MIHRVRESPYGKRNGLTGFDGLVTYWANYSGFTDELYAQLSLTGLHVRNASEKWLSCRREILDFLSLPQSEDAVAQPDLTRFVGDYGIEGDNADQTWEVTLEGDELLACGLPGVWPRVRLLPTTSLNDFLVESFPCVLSFEVDEVGSVPRVWVRGRKLLDRAPAGRYERISATAGS
jgi:hypothetical protein